MSEAAIIGTVSKEKLDISAIVKTDKFKNQSPFVQSPRTSMEIALILKI